jgi:hypothetical protein
MGIQIIIEVVEVPYEEEMMKNYCYRAYSGNKNKAA